MLRYIYVSVVEITLSHGCMRNKWLPDDAIFDFICQHMASYFNGSINKNHLRRVLTSIDVIYTSTGVKLQVYSNMRCIFRERHKFYFIYATTENPPAPITSQEHWTTIFQLNHIYSVSSILEKIHCEINQWINGISTGITNQTTKTRSQATTLPFTPNTSRKLSFTPTPVSKKHLPTPSTPTPTVLNYYDTMWENARQETGSVWEQKEIRELFSSPTHLPSSDLTLKVLQEMTGKEVGVQWVRRGSHPSSKYKVWIGAMADSKHISMMENIWGTTHPMGRVRNRRVGTTLVEINYGEYSVLHP